MAKVTYLIGAGASAGALPVVKNFTKDLIDIINKLDALNATNDRFRDPTIFLLRYTTARRILNFLLEGCENHMSIDTFCKMLYLTGRDEDYRNAKNGIILFFELYRFFYGSYDKRYDAFFATILKKEKPRLPDNINIISWNYDCEFEKAFLNYHYPAITMDEVYEELNVFHKNNQKKSGLQRKFGVLKINGTAGYYDNSGEIMLGMKMWKNYAQNDGKNHARLFLILEEFETYISDDKYTPMISFAWDDDYGERKIKEEIIDIVSTSEVLVVIGYSFPYFNREIDKYIFSHLGNRFGHIKKKIFVQDIAPQDLRRMSMR